MMRIGMAILSILGLAVLRPAVARACSGKVLSPEELVEWTEVMLFER